MPRCGRIRSYIREFNESYKTRKISFIPPYLILMLEIILITHAIYVEFNEFIISVTSVLVIISVIEIILVSSEIHDHYQEQNFERILTIKLDDYITEGKEKNVKKIVSGFTNKYPTYKNLRGKIYHTTCQILETHQEEKFEKEIERKLKIFIKKQKEFTVDEIVENFVNKNPSFKKFRAEIYEKACTLMDKE